MSFTTSATSEELRLHVVPALRGALLAPLLAHEPNIPAVLELARSYGLSRDDVMETMQVLQTLPPGRSDQFNNVQSKVKSAFTRKFKQQSSRLAQGMGSEMLKSSTSADFRVKKAGRKGKKRKAGGPAKKKPRKK